MTARNPLRRWATRGVTAALTVLALAAGARAALTGLLRLAGIAAGARAPGSHAIVTG